VTALLDFGVAGLQRAFPQQWVREMGEDIDAAFAEAIARPHGALPRGPHRFYVEIHPEQMRGFVDLVTHAWVVGVCEAVLGPEWTVVELGFDIPFPGAQAQPWHRDFGSTPDTYESRRLTSLAFNLTAVDTTDDMGPFEIAPGTQWESGLDFDQLMFPPRSEWARYEAVAVRKYPQVGDISVRSALTIHRGTANTSTRARPTLVLGVDAPGAGHDAFHAPTVTPAFWEWLPPSVRSHLTCRTSDVLTPIEQQHQIEGLLQPDD
jgi:hypothetical protein